MPGAVYCLSTRVASRVARISAQSSSPGLDRRQSFYRARAGSILGPDRSAPTDVRRPDTRWRSLARIEEDAIEIMVTSWTEHLSDVNLICNAVVATWYLRLAGATSLKVLEEI
jgi:hypothetical protein